MSPFDPNDIPEDDPRGGGRFGLGIGRDGVAGPVTPRPVRLREVSFICHMCSARFRSDKPNDPERDRGFGTCADCKEDYIADLMKFEHRTREQAEHLASRYA